MSNDISRLPKWARDRIEVLENRCRLLEQRAASFAENRPTRVCLLGELGESDFFLPDRRPIRFQVGHGPPSLRDYIEFYRTEDGQIRLHAGAPILIMPRAANTAILDLEKRQQ